MVDSFNTHSSCIIPWIHAQFLSDGTVSPCCRADYTYNYGHLKDNSFSEIWNSNNAKKLRLQMMNGEAPKACSDCFYLESLGLQSSRLEWNRKFSHEMDRIKQTNLDGSVNEAPLKYAEIRFSNLCNFSCRSCNSGSSSSWNADSKALGLPHTLGPITENKKIYQSIRPHLPHIEKIYFAGGEPLMHKDHYLLLEELIEQGRHDVELIYNTNLDQLSLKNRSVIKLWNKFDRVKVYASIDGAGIKGEMIRKGMSYKAFVKNWKTIRLMCLSVQIILQPTISVLNAFHLPDAFEQFINDGLFNQKTIIAYNFLNYPDYYNLGILNDGERIALCESYAKFFIKLETFSLDEDQKLLIKKTFQAILAWISRKEVDLANRIKFQEITRKLNDLRDEKDWFNYFPEHIEIF